MMKEIVIFGLVSIDPDQCQSFKELIIVYKQN